MLNSKGSLCFIVCVALAGVVLSPAHAQKYLTVPEFSACAALQTIGIDIYNRNQELDRINDSWYNNLNRRSSDDVARYNVSVGRQNELHEWNQKFNNLGNANCNNVSFSVADIRSVCNVSHDQMTRYLNQSAFCQNFRSKYPMTSQNEGDEQPVAQAVAMKVGADGSTDAAYVLEWVDLETQSAEVIPVSPDGE